MIQFCLLWLFLFQLVCCEDIIITIAGSGSNGYSGDNGAATSASFNGPIGIALDSAGISLINYSI